MKQTTFMMLKPDAYETHCAEQILEDLKTAGLTIECCQPCVVDIHVMQVLLLHYQEVIDQFDPSFDYPGKLFQTFYYKEKPMICPMRVSYDQEEDLIAYTRKLIGATNPIDAEKDTIRGRYSSDSYDLAGKEHRLVHNLIHASDSKETAEKELKLWSAYLK